VSIIAGKLSPKNQKRAIGIGLAMAMILGLVLLLGISVLMRMQAEWLELNNNFMYAEISGQAVILFLVGLFLLYKSTKEIYEKVELRVEDHHQPTVQSTLTKAILQITLINLFFCCRLYLNRTGHEHRSALCGIGYWDCHCGFGFDHDVICSSLWKFCQSTPLLTSFGAFFSFIDWIYAFGRGSPFVAY
jgi:hypothetical protein